MDTSTIAVGINTPCENPHSKAPTHSTAKLEENPISRIHPSTKESIATGRVAFFVTLVMDVSTSPITICAMEKILVRFPDAAASPARVPLRCMEIFVVKEIRNINSSNPRTAMITTRPLIFILFSAVWTTLPVSGRNTRISTKQINPIR